MSKSPAFQFYPKDFLSDKNVQSMTDQQLGIYIKLICHCWLDGEISSDPQELMLFATKDPERFLADWKRIEPCFQKSKKNDGKLIHPRLELEKKKQKEHSKKRSDAGKIGAKTRWSGESEPIANAMRLPSVCHSNAIAKNSSSSSSTNKINTPLESPKGDKAKRAFRLSEDWEPDEKLLTWALENYSTVDTRQQTERFKNHFIANGKRMVDWSRTWQNWIARSLEFGRPTPKPEATPKQKTHKERILEAKRVRHIHNGTVIEISDLTLDSSRLPYLKGQLFPFEQYEPIKES